MQLFGAAAVVRHRPARRPRSTGDEERWGGGGGAMRRDTTNRASMGVRDDVIFSRGRLMSGCSVGRREIFHAVAETLEQAELRGAGAEKQARAVRECASCVRVLFVPQPYGFANWVSRFSGMRI